MESGTGIPVWHSDARVAVIAALELEAGLLRQALPPGAALIQVSGPGRERAEAAARDALGHGAQALVSWGLAGGLDAAATTGSVLLPERVLAADGSWDTDPVWRRRLADALDASFRVLAGALYSATGVVTEVQAKRELAARSGAIAVDMESAGIARVAAAAGLAFVALRVVADGPADCLPHGVEQLVTAGGRTRLAGLPAMLVSPRRLGLLVGLGRSSRRARGVLGQVAAQLAAPAR
jgi:adenosylhomocysteine nucleosidase